jgi:isoquinoline 1-oxidoreductase subunit alpha
MVHLTISGRTHDVDVEPDTPLLWVIRDSVGLTGTNTAAVSRSAAPAPSTSTACRPRSCSLQVSDAVGKKITTIEGLAQNGVLHKVQQAWIDNDVPQCGYCQSGMIMAVRGTAQGQPEANRRGYRPRDHQYLPLRDVPAGARSDSRRRGEGLRESAP